jgi:molecular chaperone IbpA
MRPINIAPLYRSTVGFDRLFQLLDGIASYDADSYPPYNIERLGDHEYRVTTAVAGFNEDEIKIELKQQTLSIAGAKKSEEKQHSFLHRGIASRAFERKFQLADYVEVKGASLMNGLLHVDLVRNVPEKLKPRTIAIESGQASQQLRAAA